MHTVAIILILDKEKETAVEEPYNGSWSFSSHTVTSTATHISLA